MTVTIAQPVDTSPAQYWRVRFTVQHDSPYATLAEIQFLAETGVDVTTGGTAFASAGYGPSPSVLFNKGLSDYWASNGSSVATAGYKFSVAKAIAAVRLTFPADYPAPQESPKNYTIERSSNNSTWTVVATVVGDPIWAEGESRLIEWLQARTISGTAKLDDGRAATKVYVFDWTSGAQVGAAVPASDGSFSTRVSSATCGIVVIGPDGYQPIAHGPLAGVL